MKTSIYLFFIAAVVFLCSCKGNAYMKQRYTHFGHGAGKKSTEAVAAHRKAAPVQQPVAEIVMNAQAPVQSAAQVEAPTAPTEQVAAPKESAGPVSLKKAKQTISGAIKNTAATAGFTKKKDASDASASHRGLLSGLVGLVLYIVISAVVIAAIIILVLLII